MDQVAATSMPHSRVMQGSSSWGAWEGGKGQPYRMPFTSTSFSASVRGNQAMSHRLVWCHEHCHNIENRDRRQLIKQCMSEMHWGVTFLKKALQFSRWLEETECENYVLVVGWREAQPCLRTLQQTCHFPLMVIIICVSHKQYMRATAFVAAASQRICVQVCEYHDIPQWLLEGRIRQCFGPLEEALEESRTSSIGASSSCQETLAQHQQLMVAGVLRSACGEDCIARTRRETQQLQQKQENAAPTAVLAPSKLVGCSPNLTERAAQPATLWLDTAGVTVQRLSL